MPQHVEGAVQAQAPVVEDDAVYLEILAGRMRTWRPAWCSCLACCWLPEQQAECACQLSHRGSTWNGMVSSSMLAVHDQVIVQLHVQLLLEGELFSVN